MKPAVNLSRIAHAMTCGWAHADSAWRQHCLVLFQATAHATRSHHWDFPLALLRKTAGNSTILFLHDTRWHTGHANIHDRHGEPTGAAQKYAKVRSQSLQIWLTPASTAARQIGKLYLLSISVEVCGVWLQPCQRRSVEQPWVQVAGGVGNAPTHVLARIGAGARRRFIPVIS